MRHPVWPGSIAIVALLASAVGCVSPSGPLEWLHSRGAAIRVKADGTRTRWEPV